MAKIRKFQSSFVAGELDPNLYGRADIEDYNNGAIKLRNVYVRPQGGIERREGARYVLDVSANNKAKLIPFQFNEEQVYLLVFTAGRLDIYDEDGDSITSITSSPISTLTGDQVQEMSYTQSADTIFLFHKDVQPIKLQRTGAATWTASSVTFKNIPAYNFADGSYTGTNEVQNIKLTGSGWHTDETSFKFILNGYETEPVRWNVTPATTAARIQDALDALEITATSGISVNYVSAYEYIVTFAGDNGSKPWGSMAYEITAYVSGVQNISVSVTTEGDTGGEDIMSSTRGWPRAGIFHKQRLWLAGFRERPQTVLASHIGDYYNVGEGEALATDGINFTINSSTVDAIRHLNSGRSLTIFTTGSEYSLRSSTNDSITPENVIGQLSRETSHGSTRVNPIEFDGAIIFIESDNPTSETSGRILRQFIFNDSEQSFNANNISIFSQHLINNPVSMAVRRSSPSFPANYLYVVNGDGTVAVCTSMREQNLLAWTLFESDTYLFEDVAVIGNKTYFVMLNGTERTVGVLDSDYLLDGGIKASYPTPYRYWRAVKANAAGAGNYHTELELFENSTDVTPTSGYSQSGLQAFTASNLYDNITSTQAFYTDTTAIGDYLQVDLGSGNEAAINRWRFYVDGAVVAEWDIQASSDGITWTTVASGLDCSGGAGWKELKWTAYSAPSETGTTTSFRIADPIYNGDTLNSVGENDELLSDVTLDSNGDFTVSSAVNDVEIGYSFYAEVQSMSIDVVVQGQSFTGEYKTMPVINVNFKDTRQAKSYFEGNTWDIPFSAEYTGWKKVYLRGNTKDLKPTIKQTEPLKFGIMSIQYEVKI